MEKRSQGKVGLPQEQGEGAWSPRALWVPVFMPCVDVRLRVDLLPPRNESSPGPGTQSATGRWVHGGILGSAFFSPEWHYLSFK